MRNVADFKLSPTEMLLIQAYRVVDDETQDFLLRFVQDTAEDPMFMRSNSSRPVLRLIAGGAQ